MRRFPSRQPVSMSTPHASHFCLPRRKLTRIALQHNATLGRCQTHMRMLNYPPNSKRKAGRSYLSGHIRQIIPWSMSRVRSCLPFWAFFSVLNLLSTDPEWPGLPGWQVRARALPGFVWFPAPVPWPFWTVLSPALGSFLPHRNWRLLISANLQSFLRAADLSCVLLCELQLLGPSRLPALLLNLGQAPDSTWAPHSAPQSENSAGS